MIHLETGRFLSSTKLLLQYATIQKYGVTVRPSEQSRTDHP